MNRRRAQLLPLLTAATMTMGDRESARRPPDASGNTPASDSTGGAAVADAGPLDTRAEFEGHYQAWTHWYETGPHRESSSRALTRHPDFDAIVAMGRRALPLVFEKMEQKRDV